MRGYVKQRSKDSWSIVIYLGRGADGKKKYKWQTVRGTKKQAEAQLTALLNQLNTGEYVEPTKLAFGDFLERWLSDVVQLSARPRTYAWCRQVVSNHIKPRLGGIMLQKLTALDLQRYYREVLQSGRLDTSGKPTGEPLSPTTVRGHHRIIHRALTQALKWQLVARNIATAADAPQAAHTECITLTPEQAAAMLDASKPTGRYALYLMALTAGLRRAELLGLRWRDADLDAGRIKVRQVLRRGGQHPEFAEPKTKKSTRVVPIPEELIAALRALRKEQARQRLQYGSEYRDFGLVFTVADGGPISPRNLDRQFKSLLQKAGLPDVRFHDLRHTHATLLLAQGIHPKIVSERLGHSSITITMDLYSHALPTLQEQAAAAAADAIFGRKNAKQA